MAHANSQGGLRPARKVRDLGAPFATSPPRAIRLICAASQFSPRRARAERASHLIPGRFVTSWDHLITIVYSICPRRVFFDSYGRTGRAGTQASVARAQRRGLVNAE